MGWLRPETSVRSLLGGGLSGVVVVASLAIIGWQGARATWLIVPSPGSDRAPPPRTASLGQSSNSSQESDIDIQGIVSGHLFGRSESSESQAPNAPETKLDLELSGVYYEEGGQSIALINTGSSGQSAFRAGDKVLNQVLIESIRPEKVILKRNGRREVLPLETETLSSVNQETEAGDSPRGDAGQTDSADTLSDAGGELTEQVRPSPVRNNDGEIIGFRLRPKGGSKLFEGTELRQGDIVTAVDGTRLRGAATALKAMQSLRNRSRVNLTVQRDGQEREVNLQLP